MLKKLYYWFHRVSSKPEERGEYSSGYWQDRIREKAFFLCPESQGRLLEVGCGEGLFLARLASLNTDIEIYGVDNREDILQKADKRFREKNIKNVRLFHTDATALPFESSYFDVVVCINVIFNLKSRDIVKKVLHEMSRICKKGGRVILDFRNSKNPLLYLKYKFAPFYDQTVRGLPLKTYALEDMHLLLDEVGLEVTKEIGIGFPIKKIAPIIILEAEKK